MPHNWVYRLNSGFQTISIYARESIGILKYKALEFANSIRAFVGYAPAEKMRQFIIYYQAAASITALATLYARHSGIDERSQGKCFKIRTFIFFDIFSYALISH
jgi:hypothetical protein